MGISNKEPCDAKISGVIFLEPIPWEWLVGDVLVLSLFVLMFVYIIKRETHPIPRVLEIFAFVFIYASVYENAAGVMGLYDFGRSYIMIGSIPASIPLIEVMVLITGFWILEKTKFPEWTKPPIIGLFGMLQDFSLDPLAIRQISSLREHISGRWNWLIQAGDPNILDVPVFNFPGWMLIMLYSAACLLLGRWWYCKSGYKRIVGVVYPIIAMIAALLLMVSPLSNFLLWLEPFFKKPAMQNGS